MSLRKRTSNYDVFGLTGKTAVISGGAVNIGRAVTRALADAGVKTAIIYNSSSTPAEKLVEEIESFGGIAMAYKADVRDERQVTDVFEQVNADSRFGEVDIMVNNSGIFSTSLQTELPADEWERIFDVNVKGMFLCSREAVRRMQAKNADEGYRGVIVNIASINALHPGFGLTAHYDATKGAVASYTKSLAAELGSEGIRVNAVAPGLVDAKALRKFAPELAEKVLSRNPLKNAAGESRLVQPDDIAETVRFLCSDMASSITGETIVVDRGYLLS